MMCSGCQHDPPIATMFISRMVSRITAKAYALLSIRTKIIGEYDVAGIDFVPLHEFIDLDRARRFQRDVFEFFLGHFDVVSVSTLKPSDVLVAISLRRIRVDARIF